MGRVGVGVGVQRGRGGVKAEIEVKAGLYLGRGFKLLRW